MADDPMTSRAHGVKCRKFDEHGDDSFGTPADSDWRRHCGMNAPVTQDELDDYCDSKEDVDQERDRKVYRST